MKKILLVSLILLSSTINAEICYYKNLIEKESLFYKKGPDKPYSGSVKGSQIGLMEQGKREKEWKELYPNGNIKREVSFKNGVQHGLGSFYFPDVKLLMRGNLINGLQDGVWKKFYFNGMWRLSSHLKKEIEKGLRRYLMKPVKLNLKNGV